MHAREEKRVRNLFLGGGRPCPLLPVTSLSFADDEDSRDERR
jgi:hypothetical protein